MTKVVNDWILLNSHQPLFGTRCNHNTSYKRLQGFYPPILGKLTSHMGVNLVIPTPMGRITQCHLARKVLGTSTSSADTILVLEDDKSYWWSTDTPNTLVVDSEKADEEDMITLTKDILFAPNHYFDIFGSRISDTEKTSEYKVRHRKWKATSYIKPLPTFCLSSLGPSVLHG